MVFVVGGKYTEKNLHASVYFHARICSTTIQQPIQIPGRYMLERKVVNEKVMGRSEPLRKRSREIQ